MFSKDATHPFVRDFYAYLRSMEEQTYEATKQKYRRSVEYLVSIENTVNRFEGFTDREIAEVLLAQRVESLPKLYHDYLRVMGKSHGLTLNMADINSLEALKIAHNTLGNSIKLCEIPTFLTDNTAYFVFYMFQGEDFFFFDTHTNTEDPNVLYYHEGYNTFIDMKILLSSWLKTHATYEGGILIWLNHNMREQMMTVNGHNNNDISPQPF